MSEFLEFHISKKYRDRCGFDERLFSVKDNVVFSDFHTVRLFAKRMNETRENGADPERTIKAGDLNAMGLIDEISHLIFDQYRKERNPDLIVLAQKRLVENLGRESVENTVVRFLEHFPPVDVYRGEQSVEEYLMDKTGGTPNLLVALEEMVLLFLCNRNTAFSPFAELFDDRDLWRETAYLSIMESLDGFFKTQPVFGPESQTILEMLKAPATAAPRSLSGQLYYIKDHWGSLLSGDVMIRILLALDVIREEEKLRLLTAGPAAAPEYRPGLGLYDEPERFSRDLDWMPQVVLIAKSVSVWFDQLSKQYGWPIVRLDQIPDEELDRLARWGFTGLWLIGLWERSPASRKIKQLTGNPEALGSAYAIYDYQVARDLGGEEALQRLKERAGRRGILLASDMVPNHTGIDSTWVMERPDWFLQLEKCPFPGYRFTGSNLSGNEDVGIFIEDGYWDRSDAAVVFKRIDHSSGETRYIYHGNDGTSMPWNDTAQLDFLRADVREAVIQTILKVARKFPIIRFDAAMTLTKRHFQRLWHPQPGTGGDIPSRAEHAMSSEGFNKLFPIEFWREVVDRVAEEAPDTLLLAEAFWLMEGYFVRTLGMHRVYNSAFMNMLKMEENAKYRQMMKNVLEFNPEILRRFVNFMNNPDEETAVAQFGKGDKYIGIALMMVTLPGLPMFGHGQIEGLSEKYGMEYSKAYWNEQVDWNLVERHEKEIFPLMRKRQLFAGVENFTLYDFYDVGGGIDENVFAYSNRSGDERVLIIYNNRYQTTRGWVKMSTPMVTSKNGSGEGKLSQRNLAEALAIRDEDGYAYIFRDHESGLEYIRRGKEFSDDGLYVELGAYQYHVFVDFREIQDDRAGHYGQLESLLQGRGVPDVEEALKEMILAPIHDPFREIMNPLMLQRLSNLHRDGFDAPQSEKAVNLFRESVGKLLQEIERKTDAGDDHTKIVEDILRLLRSIVRLSLETSTEWRVYPKLRLALSRLRALTFTEKGPKSTFWRVSLAWLVVTDLGRIKLDREYEQQSAAWIDEWLLGKIIFQTFQSLGCDEEKAKGEADLVKILTCHRHWFVSQPKKDETRSKLTGLFLDQDAQQFLQFNWYDNVLWFNKERHEELMEWLLLVSIYDVLARNMAMDDLMVAAVWERLKTIRRVLQMAERSKYRVESMLSALSKSRF